MRVGFVVTRRAQEIEVQISAPENNDQSALVTYSRAGDSFALLMGRLYYRSDRLAELLGICAPEALRESQGNDAALVLAVYRHLGRTALERLEGDFALVLWDAQNTELIGLRDPLGGYPLFWVQHESTVALSTNLRPLCAILPQCTLNEAYFADFVLMHAPCQEGQSEQCVYLGIHRVLPGTIVRAKGDCARIERRAYWDWLKHIKDPGTSERAEIAEQYRPLLRAAVQERMRGCTLAHLSGGMDSTSVALLARDLASSGMGQAPIHTISQVYDRLPLLAQERAYIESALHNQTALVAHQLLSDDLLDFDSFNDPPLHDEPYVALAYLTAGLHIGRLADSIGALTILTGHGSDEIHVELPSYIADLLRQRHFGQAWQEATKWAKGLNQSAWTVLATFGIHPLVAPWVAGSRWASILSKRQEDWSLPNWILPSFARRHAMKSRAVENARQMYRQSEQTRLSLTLYGLRQRAGDVFRWSVAAPLGISQAHPFLDPRLITFGLGMQSRIQPRPKQSKPVLAEAMRGILPDLIRSRGKGGFFNEVYYLGLARNLPSLEAMVRQAPLEGMIDKALLLQHLRVGSIAGVPLRALEPLTCTLALLKWLCMQKEWLQVREKVSLTDHIVLQGERG